MAQESGPSRNGCSGSADGTVPPDNRRRDRRCKRRACRNSLGWVDIRRTARSSSPTPVQRSHMGEELRRWFGDEVNGHQSPGQLRLARVVGRTARPGFIRSAGRVVSQHRPLGDHSGYSGKDFPWVGDLLVASLRGGTPLANCPRAQPGSAGRDGKRRPGALLEGLGDEFAAVGMSPERPSLRRIDNTDGGGKLRRAIKLYRVVRQNAPDRAVNATSAEERRRGTLRIGELAPRRDARDNTTAPASVSFQPAPRVIPT